MFLFRYTKFYEIMELGFHRFRYEFGVFHAEYFKNLCHVSFLWRMMYVIETIFSDLMYIIYRLISQLLNFEVLPDISFIKPIENQSFM